MMSCSNADESNQVASSDPPLKKTSAIMKLSSSTLTSPSSSSAIPGDSLPILPFDLVVEILSRVPVKSLMQLQCVCKSWKSLISDPKFAKKHLRVSTTRPHLLVSIFTLASLEVIHMSYPLSSVFTEVTPIPTTLHLDYPLNHPNTLILVASCHGILCFALDQNYALLWNPSISKFTKSPYLEVTPTRMGPYYFTKYGFGYDHSSDTYKVVALSWYESLTNGNKAMKTQVNVHTMGTDYWRRIQTHFPYRFPNTGTGNFVSGTFNWFEAEFCFPYSLRIVSFDLETESFREILQPNYGVMMTAFSPILNVMMDCLCILCHGDTLADVWLMKEYGNEDSWTKLFRVPYMGDADIQALDFCPYNKALYVSNDEQLLLGSMHELVVYNSTDGTFKALGIQEIDGRLCPEVYHESLISPCS